MLGLEICHSLKVEKPSFGPHRKQLDVSFQNALFCDVDIKLMALSKLFSLLDGVFCTPDSGKVTTYPTEVLNIQMNPYFFSFLYRQGFPSSSFSFP